MTTKQIINDEFLNCLSTKTLRKVSKGLDSDFTRMKLFGVTSDIDIFNELKWVMWRVAKIIDERA